MSARALAAAVAVALAGIAGPAQADTFTTLDPGAAPVAAPLVLPGAETPNAVGSLVLPPGWTEAPSTAVAQRSYPELQELWGRAGEAYGIPWQVLAAINKIETNFGGNMGPSSAGAVGWMQFMPDTWLRWGLDANGDGIADPWNPDDAVYSAARYLAAVGGVTDIERGVFAYNHADWYVRDVLELAATYGAGVVPGVDFAADRVDLRVEQAEAVVAAQQERVDAAEREAGRLAADEQRLLEQAATTRLLSDELALRRRAGAISAERAAAEALVATLTLGLGEAQTALEAARTASVPAFAGGGYAGPSYAGSYVFPVGGGATVVSVSHYHHDYPSADIAAPMGTPLYALADGIVDSSWATENGKCGIGLRLATADGQLWTYCHLSYLDPAVVPGAALAAGAFVGLVGSTGHSTGPHLHLGLVPTSSYPQDQEWFRSFEGVAYTWQDPDPGRVVSTTTAAAAAGPVFAVVLEDQPLPADVVTFTR